MSIIRLSLSVFSALIFAACEKPEEKRSVEINGETIEYTVPTADAKDVAKGKKYYEEHTLKRRAAEGINSKITDQFAPLGYQAYTRAKKAGDNWIPETDAILNQLSVLVKTYPNSPELRWRFNQALATTAANVANNPRPGGLDYIEQLSDRSLENVHFDTSHSHSVLAGSKSIFLSEWWVRALNTEGRPNVDYSKPLAAVMRVREVFPEDLMIARAHAEVYTRIDFDKLGGAELRDFDALIRDFKDTSGFQSKIEKLNQLPGYKKRLSTP